MATVFDDLVRARIKQWQTSAAVYHVCAQSYRNRILEYEDSGCVLAGWTETPQKIPMTEDRFQSLEKLFSTEAVKKNGLQVLNRFDVFNLAVYEVLKALRKFGTVTLPVMGIDPLFGCKSIRKLTRFAINSVFLVCSVEIDSDETLSMETFCRIAQFYLDQSPSLTMAVLSMNSTWHLLQAAKLEFVFGKVNFSLNCPELPLEKTLKFKKPKNTQEQTELANALSRSLIFRKEPHEDFLFLNSIKAFKLLKVRRRCCAIPFDIKSSTQNYLNLLNLAMKAVGMPCLYETYGNHELTTRLASNESQTERVIKIDKFRGWAHFCWNQLCFFPWCRFLFFCSRHAFRSWTASRIFVRKQCRRNRQRCPAREACGKKKSGFLKTIILIDDDSIVISD